MLINETVLKSNAACCFVLTCNNYKAFLMGKFLSPVGAKYKKNVNFTSINDSVFPLFMSLDSCQIYIKFMFYYIFIN